GGAAGPDRSAALRVRGGYNRVFMANAHTDLAEGLRLKPGKRVRLDEVDPGDPLGLPGKEQAQRALEKNVEHIAALQERLHAEHRRALLVIFQALDAGGKDGTTR